MYARLEKIKKATELRKDAEGNLKPVQAWQKKQSYERFVFAVFQVVEDSYLHRPARLCSAGKQYSEESYINLLLGMRGLYKVTSLSYSTPYYIQSRPGITVYIRCVTLSTTTVCFCDDVLEEIHEWSIHNKSLSEKSYHESYHCIDSSHADDENLEHIGSRSFKMYSGAVPIPGLTHYYVPVQTHTATVHWREVALFQKHNKGAHIFTSVYDISSKNLCLSQTSSPFLPTSILFWNLLAMISTSHRSTKPGYGTNWAL